MSSITIVVKSELRQDHLQQRLRLDENQSHEAARALSDLFRAMAGGVFQGSVDVQTADADPVAASGTFTVASAVATDAVTIGTVTLTASSTPADENEWEIDGADDAADAAALAAAINAHSVLSKVVSAEAAAGVVTVTALQKGEIGNQIPISSADATITASGSFLEDGAGGADEAPVTFSLGL